MNSQLPPFKPLITEKEITRAITQLADSLNEEYFSKELVIVAVLKGVVPFLADLLRKLNCLVEVEFVRAGSYGKRGKERGPLTLFSMDHLDLQGKNVLILDDICDSGATLSALAKQLESHRPSSLKSAVLLTKKRSLPPLFTPDYTLFEIEDHFVIGYGLDYKEKYRNLSCICLYQEAL